VPRDDLIVLPQQRQRIMGHAVILARITQVHPMADQTMAPIEAARGSRPGSLVIRVSEKSARMS